MKGPIVRIYSHQFRKGLVPIETLFSGRFSVRDPENLVLLCNIIPINGICFLTGGIYFPILIEQENASAVSTQHVAGKQAAHFGILLAGIH